MQEQLSPKGANNGGLFIKISSCKEIKVDTQTKVNEHKIILGCRGIHINSSLIFCSRKNKKLHDPLKICYIKH